MPLPQFNRIVFNNILDSLKKLLDQNSSELNTHLEKTKTPTWESVVPFIETLENRLALFWSPISHLHAVKNTKECREVYQQALPLLTDYQTSMNQHSGLYHAFSLLKQSPDFLKLNPMQKRIIDLQLRDFRLSGIELSDENKKHYREIESQISLLSTKFGENVLDATEAWHFTTKDETLLKGLPKHTLRNAQKLAKQHEEKGYRLTLDYPCYSAVQKYAEERTLREKFYNAHVTRASELSTTQFNNSPIMNEILMLKYKMAKLLGYENFVTLSLETKMASSPEEVRKFLEGLLAHAKPKAKQEYDELVQFAGHEIKPWDLYYYSEKLSRKRYHIDQELLRPYFSLPQVLKTLFSLVERVFGLNIHPLSNIEVWHPDVSCYEILDDSNQCTGIFYTDLYVREQKREGAWMDDYCGRFRDSQGNLQIPVAFLTCNFAKPEENHPALLTHDDVITLFHEFGHGLHHLLTKIDYLELSGMQNVPWDVVEFPSQFMENWCWQKEILVEMARHYETGEVLPEKLMETLLQSRHFHAGLFLVRQLEFALFDLYLHLQKPEGDTFIIDVAKKIREKTAVYDVPDYYRFQNTFSHIFDGSYAAGYYSYLWAEVLSSDAFSKFEEEGLFNSEVGKKFLDTILGQGGSKPAEELFIEYRGRAPDPKALLKSWGLIDVSENRT